MSKCSKKCNEIKEKINKISGLDDDIVYDWLKRLENVTEAITDIINDYSDRNELNGTCFKEYNERLKIEFSKNGEGSILMTAVGNSLYLDKATIDNLKIGDKVAMNSEGLKPLAQLNFYKVETIDIFMEKLIAIKNNIILNSAS